MATLTLTKLWINLLSTGDAVSAQHLADPDESYDMEGEVRKYAGGRMRAITTVGEFGTFSFVLVDVTLPTIVTLRAWKGLPVQVRDHRGQLFQGVYFGVKPQPVKLPATLYNVPITLRTVTVEATP